MTGSLGTDGRRLRPYPADVSGRFTRARRIVYVALITLWACLPWIEISGRPALFLDIGRRTFFLFGGTFNAQDLPLLFFLVSGFGFGLIVMTSLLGRAWCGWACPQTVFIETLFRPIERLVNGPRNTALARKRGPLTIDRAWRMAITHALYALAALFAAHVFVAYFVSLPALFAMVRTRPAAHPEVFGWMLALTALFYGVFGLFREQFCVVLCPYGRLQSVLVDDDSLVIGYDESRGEPRGKAKAAGAADCVDCRRCVVVCPTGIDIRDGQQLDCIACTACIDACDEVMVKLGRSKGLVRYDSVRGLRGEKRRFLRPRLGLYAALLAFGLAASTFALRRRSPLEANLLRLPGAPYALDGDVIRNGFEVHLVNKTAQTMHVRLQPEPRANLAFVVPMDVVDVEALGSRRVPFFVTMDRARFEKAVPFAVRIEGERASRDVTATFLGAHP
jgi:cytochrome c oxidase accessory protein FixG